MKVAGVWLAFVPIALAACSNEETPLVRIPPFADLDTNDDGFLSEGETSKVPELADVYAFADQDQDRQLSVAEFSMATVEGTTVSLKNAGGPFFRAVDKDGDGKVSPSEAAALPRIGERFASYDADQNGSLSEDEYSEAVRETIAEQ